MSTETVLTDEEIVTIGRQARAIEPGENGYILPITFARAIEQAVLQPASDVSALVEALEDIAQWSERWAFPGHPVATIARKALAAHREQGGSND